MESEWSANGIVWNSSFIFQWEEAEEDDEESIRRGKVGGSKKKVIKLLATVFIYKNENVFFFLIKIPNGRIYTARKKSLFWQIYLILYIFGIIFFNSLRILLIWQLFVCYNKLKFDDMKVELINNCVTNFSSLALAVQVIPI